VVRPKPYPEHPTTLGGHLLKRRSISGLLQREVAARFGINIWTYLLWEQDRTQPVVRYWPAIIDFLGYDPISADDSWAGQVRAKRRRLGLTVNAAAALAGVDEGTFRRWERGLRTVQSKAALDEFLVENCLEPTSSTL
jgi:transcriptional regulator with XRE-family HTH domain